MDGIVNFLQQIDFMTILTRTFVFLVGDGGLLALITFILTLSKSLNHQGTAKDDNVGKDSTENTEKKKISGSFLKISAVVFGVFVLIVGLNVLMNIFAPKPEPTDYAFAVKEDDTVCITGLFNKDVTECLIPETIRGHKVTEIRSGAFKDCDNITSITIPDTVKLIGSDAFEDCDNLVFVMVNDNNEYFSSVDGVLYNKSRTKLLYYPDEKKKGEIIDSGICGDYVNWTFYQSGLLFISGSGGMDFKNQKENNYAPWCDYASQITLVLIDGPITSVANTAFRMCDRITSIVLPESVSTIGVSSFSTCTALTKITIPEHLTTICNAAFVNCSSLTQIDLPNSLSTIGTDSFNKCISIKEIRIPQSVTSIPFRAFYNCSNLKKVDIPDSVTNIGDSAFSHCSRLSEVNLSSSLTRIGAAAFLCCYEIKKINIPESVTIIDHDAFSQCYSIKSVHTPKTINSIGYGAFWKCQSLESFTFPDSISSIENVIFQHCISLTSVTIPNSVKTIQPNAFSGCNNLEDVYFKGTEEEWNKITIKEKNEPLLNATIHFQGQ